MLPREQKNPKIITVNRTSTVEFIINKSIDSKGYGVATFLTLLANFIFYIVAILMIFCFTKFGTISSYLRMPKDDTDYTNSNFTPERVISEEERKELLRRQVLTVNLLAQAPVKSQRRSFNYCWHIMSIAIFYSIPVVQLVITYQRVVNRTGDQDMCYYNFLCANPAFGLSDFNHVVSNVGYVFMGILFLGAVFYRHVKIPNNTVSYSKF